MKKNFCLYMILGALLGILAGCSGDEKIASGEGTLGIAIQTDSTHNVVSTRAAGPDVNTYPVEIWEEQTLFKKFASFQELKNTGTLRITVGKAYVIKAHQPGEMPEIGDRPYYGGESEPFVAREGFNPVSIVCTMQNVKVTVKLASELLDKIKDDYTVRISNGTQEGVWMGSAADFDPFTHESGLTYFKAGGPLTVMMSGHSNAYDPAEPFSIEQIIPVAPNDDVKITIGLKSDAVRKVSPRMFNLKMTVDK